jgi:hypothetical protein
MSAIGVAGFSDRDNSARFTSFHWDLPDLTKSER